MEKMTKIQKFAQVVVALQGGQPTMSTEDMVAFIERESALLVGKSERKASKKSDANADYKTAVVTALAGCSEPVTVTTVLAETGLAISNQKMTAVLKALVEEGKVINTKDKKGSFYSLAEPDGEDAE